MALTKVSTPAIKDEAITLAKLLHGDSNSNGKFLRANNGADPTFETVNTDLVADTSPQLGGDLDSNGNNIKITDGEELRLGDGNDLVIKHDGSHSYINDNGDGNLYVSVSSKLHIQNQAQDESIAVFNENGNCELYYDNGKKFETTSYGGLLSGNLQVNTVYPSADSSYDLGTNSTRFANAYVDTYYGDGSNLTGISAGTSLSGSTDNTICTVTGANAIQGESNLTYDGDKLVVKSGTHDGGLEVLAANNNQTTRIKIQGKHSGGSERNWFIEVPRGSDILNFFDDSHGSHTQLIDNGNLSIVDGNLAVASGHGIDFSAASDASGMTSELLDDYEEGNFTIVAGSGSSVTFNSGNNYASYTKIGRQVTIAGQLRINSGSGNVRIALPFNSAADTEDNDMAFAASVIGYDYNAQNGSDCDGLFILVDSNSSYARFMEHRDNNPWTSLDGDAGAYLRFTLTYFVA